MKAKIQRKRGRPLGYRKEDPASVTIPRVRVTPDQLAIYKTASAAAGKNFSQWVREALDQKVQTADAKLEHSTKDTDNE